MDGTLYSNGCLIRAGVATLRGDVNEDVEETVRGETISGSLSLESSRTWVVGTNRRGHLTNDRVVCLERHPGNLEGDLSPSVPVPVLGVSPYDHGGTIESHLSGCTIDLEGTRPDRAESRRCQPRGKRPPMGA